VLRQYSSVGELTETSNRSFPEALFSERYLVWQHVRPATQIALGYECRAQVYAVRIYL